MIMQTTVSEKTIEDLTRLILALDTIIENMGEILDFNQRQRKLFFEQRAQLIAEKEASISNPNTSTKSFSGTGEQAMDAFGIHNPVVSAINYAQRYVDRETARVEQTLKEQREWKAEHPGHQHQ
jgi:hypothetical protein